MRSLAVIVTLLTVQTVIAEPQRKPIGSDAKYTFFVDASRVASVQYPTVGGIGLIRKSFKETWVIASDGNGKTAVQFLWIFDCAGRAAQLAVAVKDGVSEYKSYDVTVEAERIGAERYLQRIPPDSYYDHAQSFICKLK